MSVRSGAFQLSQAGRTVFRWTTHQPVTFTTCYESKEVHMEVHTTSLYKVNSTNFLWYLVHNIVSGVVCFDAMIAQQKIKITHTKCNLSGENKSTCIILNLHQPDYPSWLPVSCTKPLLNTVTCQKTKGEFTMQTLQMVLANFSGLPYCKEKAYLLFGSECFTLGAYQQELPFAAADPSLVLYIRQMFDIKKYYYFGQSKTVTPNIFIALKTSKVTSYREKVSTANILFCENRVAISTSNLCDGVQDCGDQNSSDEHTNICPGCPSEQYPHCRSSQHKCKQNLFQKINGQCSTFTHSFKTPGMDRRVSPKAKRPQPNSFQKFECFSEKNEHFVFYQRCLYQTDEFGHLLFCSNGRHLSGCSEFQCSTHLKCPASYCISVACVCNGKWDCPCGFDEQNCYSLECSGFFKCKLTKICVHLADVCDGNQQCPVGDDEEMCDSVQCHNNHCSCLTYAITCVNSTGISEYITKEHPLPFVYFHVEKSSFQLLGSPLLHTCHKILVEIPNNGIKQMCGLHFKMVILLDLSSNVATCLLNNCFSGMPNLQILSLKQNRIFYLSVGAFSNVSSLQVIHLSENLVESVKPFTFCLSEIKFISVVQSNMFSTISTKTFSGSSSSIHVITNDPNLCCMVPGHCVASTRVVPANCEHLLFSLGLSAFTCFFGSLVGLTNVFCFVWIVLHQTGNKTGNNNPQLGFRKITCTMYLTGVLSSLLTLVLCITDQHYGAAYLEVFISKKNGLFCVFVGSGQFFTWMFSMVLVCFLAFARYSTAVHPLKSKLKHSGFVKKCVHFMLALLAFLTCSVSVKHHLFVGFHLLSSPFAPSLPTHLWVFFHGC